MIHVFSDVIHVSTLLDIRLFLTIFGFSKPKLGGGTQMWYPLACEVAFTCFMLAIEKGTRSPTTLGCLAVRESRGNAFAFVRRFCLRCCSYHYSAIGSALPFQCFREEIALQDQQIFSDGFVIGHMRDAGQRQECVLASGRHQRLAQA